jgi:hypothetical protein
MSGSPSPNQVPEGLSGSANNVYAWDVVVENSSKKTIMKRYFRIFPPVPLSYDPFRSAQPVVNNYQAKTMQILT